MLHWADDPNHPTERNVFTEKKEASLIGRTRMLLSTRLSSYTVGGRDQTDESGGVWSRNPIGQERGPT